MKKYIWLIVFVVVFASITVTMALLNRKCTLGDGRVCYNEEVGRYEIEDNAKLSVMVSQQSVADWLTTYFQEDITSGKLTLDFVVQQEVTAWDAVNQSVADVILIQQDQAAMIFDRFLPVDNQLIIKYLIDDIPQFHSLINEETPLWIPQTIDGLLFIYNKTMLDELGINTEQRNEFNLPEQLASWEAISELNQSILEEDILFKSKRIQSAFPLTFQEKWQFYPFLTASGWQMLESNKSSDPGFDSIELFSSLNYLMWMEKMFGSASWQYEKVISEFISPFGVASPWMFVTEIEAMYEVDFVYAAYPSYQGNVMTPLARVAGYAVMDNAYPSASMAVLDALLSDEIVKLQLENKETSIVISPQRRGDFELTDNQKDHMIAYDYSVSEPLVALENNPSVRAWEFYMEGHVTEIIQLMIQGNISVEEAQIQLIKKYEEWVNE